MLKYAKKLNKRLKYKYRRDSNFLKMFTESEKEKKSKMIDINIEFYFDDIDSDEEIDKRYGHDMHHFTPKQINIIKQTIREEQRKNQPTKR